MNNKENNNASFYQNLLPTQEFCCSNAINPSRRDIAPAGYIVWLTPKANTVFFVEKDLFQKINGKNIVAISVEKVLINYDFN